MVIIIITILMIIMIIMIDQLHHIIMTMLKAGTPLWEVEVAVTSLCIALQVENRHHDGRDEYDFENDFYDDHD